MLPGPHPDFRQAHGRLATTALLFLSQPNTYVVGAAAAYELDGTLVHGCAVATKASRGEEQVFYGDIVSARSTPRGFNRSVHFLAKLEKQLSKAVEAASQPTWCPRGVFPHR